MRNHTTIYSAEELSRLRDYNESCQVFYWAGLIVLFGSATLARSLEAYLGWRRRRKVGQFALQRRRPPKGCSRTGKRCTRWVPSATLALWRKYTLSNCHIPTFGSCAQLALIIAYIALNLGLVLGGAHGDISWQAHHAARLAMANLPLVIALASKNNFISYLTGYAYDSLNILHRWSARMVFVLAVIHSAGRIYVNDPDVSPTGPGHAYIVWGIAGFTAFSVMVILATRALRNRIYSFFIITHVGLFILSIITLWVHRPQQAPWLVVGIGIYVIDRVWRTFRILQYHLFRRRLRPTPTNPIAWCEALSMDTIRVTVRTRMHWLPGQHIYLQALSIKRNCLRHVDDPFRHVPSISPGGHPFTISTISDPLVDTMRLTDSDAEKVGTTAPASRHFGAFIHHLRTYRQRELPSEARIELLIRVRKGVTRRLFNLAMASSEEPMAASPPRHDLDAWCEGPYGVVHRIGEQYQTVFLVAGGSGITFCIPLLLDIVRRARKLDAGYDDEPVATERLSLCWIIRDIAQIEWVRDHLEKAVCVAPPGLVHIQLFVTGKLITPLAEALPSDVFTAVESPLSLPLDNEQRCSAPSMHPVSYVNVDTIQNVAKPDLPQSKIVVRPGRPDLGFLLSQELEATDFSDWLSVTACGPNAIGRTLASEISKAIRPSSVLRGEVRRNGCEMSLGCIAYARTSSIVGTYISMRSNSVGEEHAMAQGPQKASIRLYDGKFVGHLLWCGCVLPKWHPQHLTVRPFGTLAGRINSLGSVEAEPIASDSKDNNVPPESGRCAY